MLPKHIEPSIRDNAANTKRRSDVRQIAVSRSKPLWQAGGLELTRLRGHLTRGDSPKKVFPNGFALTTLSSMCLTVEVDLCTPATSV